MVKSTQLLFIACFMVLATAAVSPAFAIKITGRVTKVTDGDRLTVTTNNGSSFSVRLLGIDAPEHDQPIGQLAREHLALLALGQVVTISVAGFDGEGVVSSQVFLGNRDLGEQMVRDGAAWVDTQPTALEPGTLGLYQESERLAQKERRGIWEEANPTPPWIHTRQMATEARNSQMEEEARNEKARKEQERATAKETERARQNSIQTNSTTTVLKMPASEPKVTLKTEKTVKKPDSKTQAHLIANDAPVPTGFIVIAWTASGKIVNKASDSPIKGYAIMCDGSPLPRGYSIIRQTDMQHCDRAGTNPLANAFLIKLDEPAESIASQTDATGCVREQGTHKVLDGFPEMSWPGQPALGMTPKQVVACYGQMPTDAHRTITANGEVYQLEFRSGARFTFVNGRLTQKDY